MSLFRRNSRPLRTRCSSVHCAALRRSWTSPCASACTAATMRSIWSPRPPIPVDTGVLVVENESGLLFTYGHLLGLRTASICVALGSMFADPNANVYGAYADPEHLARRIETATRIAMRAAELLEGSK